MRSNNDDGDENGGEEEEAPMHRRRRLPFTKTTHTRAPPQQSTYTHSELLGARTKSPHILFFGKRLHVRLIKPNIDVSVCALPFFFSLSIRFVFLGNLRSMTEIINFY